jgi:hypothetical protein
MSIQLQKIIDLQGLDTIKLANELFPGLKHPSMSLTRVINGDMLLNSEQVLKLSEITNIPVGFLYAAGEWLASGTLNKLSFVSGEVVAEVTPTPTKWVTKISYFHKGQPFVQTVLKPAEINAKVFLSDLTDIIIKNSKNNKY